MKMTENSGLFNKTADELTVGDSLKIQAVVIVLMAMIPVLIIGGIEAVERVKFWHNGRKLVKELNESLV